MIDRWIDTVQQHNQTQSETVKQLRANRVLVNTPRGGVNQCNTLGLEYFHVAKTRPDAKLPGMLAWDFKDVDTGGGAGVPGTVGVSSQGTVEAGWMLSTEGCGRLDHARVCTGVEGSCLRRCTFGR